MWLRDVASLASADGVIGVISEVSGQEMGLDRGLSVAGRVALPGEEMPERSVRKCRHPRLLASLGPLGRLGWAAKLWWLAAARSRVVGPGRGPGGLWLWRTEAQRD